MSVTAGVSDAVITIREKLKGKMGQTKVKRHWPGKAPDWANDDDDEDADIWMPRAATVDIIRENDPRLRRWAESRIDDRDEVRNNHRCIRQAKIVSTEDEDMLDLDLEENEEALEERRRRIRENMLLRQQEEEEEEVMLFSEESEYETDSDEEEVIGIAMVKPVFVLKSGRDTVVERERIEAENAALEAKVKKRMEERRKETKEIVVEKIKEDQEMWKNVELEDGNADMDTVDDVIKLEEYEAWKGREIARIKRDREDREAVLKEKEEIERVRNMTEEERREWETKNFKPAAKAPSKQKWKFLQRYYHKGVFFQANADDRLGTAGADDIYRRDFSAPTGEDKLNKTNLPKVMQVKHFGGSGRTKWTHLVNEDTTNWNTLWTNNDPLRAKYSQKMTGMYAPIAKPKGSKKLKNWEPR